VRSNPPGQRAKAASANGKEGCEVNHQKAVSKVLAMLVVGVLFVVGDPMPVQARGASAGARATSDIPGSYLAMLDLTPLGFGPRIEALGVVLDSGGRALFISEHEADRESAGVGVWGHLRGGMIGLGILSFRIGPEPATSICGLVGATSPPENCFLKVGGTLGRTTGGGLEGELFLTIESLDGMSVVTLPNPLPLSMERLSLQDFPGASP
jgi:hypothetical protein